MGNHRYARQMILDEVGQAGQEALTRAKVLCVGAGGLGSPVLMYLAAAGVGTLGIIDGDRVDESNLQRQILFQDETIGKFKSEIAKKNLLSQNPQVECVSYPFDFEPANAREITQEYDLVIDGSDNFETKFLINDVCTSLERPWVYGSVNRFEGQVSSFHAKKGPCYRCLYRQAPTSAYGSCAENGVLGATVGIIGSWQAFHALQIILPKLQPQWGALQIINALSGEQLRVQIPKNPDCPTCSRPSGEMMNQPDNKKIAKTAVVHSQKVSAAELRQKKNEYFIFDVRTDEEFKKGHLPGATLWPLAEIEKGRPPAQLIADAAKHGLKILLYCQGGKRSDRACQLLRQAGYDDVVELDGGIMTWSSTLE